MYLFKVSTYYPGQCEYQHFSLENICSFNSTFKWCNFAPFNLTMRNKDLSCFLSYSFLKDVQIHAKFLCWTWQKIEQKDKSDGQVESQVMNSCKKGRILFYYAGIVCFNKFCNFRQN